MKCDHEEFEAKVDVNRLTDSGRFMADIRIKCKQCGEPFRFLGLPCGVAVSADGTEARIAIGTSETVANIMDGGCPVGYTVVKEEMPKPVEKYMLYVDGKGFVNVESTHGPIKYTADCLLGSEATMADWQQFIGIQSLFSWHLMVLTAPYPNC